MAISISIKDTHAAVSALQERGASKELAEGIVATVKAAELSHDPATQYDLKAMENRLMMWMFVQYLGTVGVLSGLYAAFGG